MNTSKIRQVVAVCVASCAVLSAHAQPSETKDAPPPPKTEKLEEGDTPAITIRKPESGAKVTQKRAPGGKVTEVKVTSGKSTYYAKPNDASGSALPGDGQSNVTRPVQWKVKEFDLGHVKQPKEAENTDAAAVPPPPPPAKK